MPVTQYPAARAEIFGYVDIAVLRWR